MRHFHPVPLLLAALLFSGFTACTADSDITDRHIQVQVAPLGGEGGTAPSPATRAATGDRFRAAIDAWDETPVAIAYRTDNTQPYTVKYDAVIPDNDKNYHIDLGIEYPASGNIYLRGYYPRQPLGSDGLLTYDLSGADTDLMVSTAELSGSAANKIPTTHIMQFRHLLTRITFRLTKQAGKPFHSKVVGIRIVPRDPTMGKGMKCAVLDPTRPVTDPAADMPESARNPRYHTWGDVANIKAAGESVPDYGAATPLSIDVMFRPAVAFDIFVVNDCNVSVQVNSADAAVTTLCNGGGEAGKRYVISLGMAEGNIVATSGDWSVTENDDKIEWLPAANSYIAHPGGDPVKVPVRRINEYWRATNGTPEKYGDKSFALKSTDSWKAVVLWSDISTIAADGTACLTQSSETYSEDEYFTVTIPAGTEKGNFVVKVYRADDASKTPLWSWHIWVTDYDPDSYDGGAWSANTVYQVPGGQVESYDGVAWESGGLLYGKVMMDRALGALERGTNVSKSDTDRGRLHYQFGRKDPFPVSIDGKKTLSPLYGYFNAANGESVAMADAVKNPTTFYTQSWMGAYNGNSGVGDTYLWHDPLAGSGKKSIYDPCPPGWRIPEMATGNSKGSPWEKFESTKKAYGEYAYAQLEYRDAKFGQMGYGKNCGYYWSATEKNAGDAYILYIKEDGVASSCRNELQVTGLSVRCSRQ
ncbi:MAG: fimbrillin family protein [Prevotellaceae bacterium]|jgi:hypothetical protein|nr:fimbrillin family protein [Prevotellaceae bacterium]